MSENYLSVERMAEMGITNETICQLLRNESCIWVAVHDDRVVGFSIADVAEARVFAAFVLPQWAGQGVGRLLMKRAEAFLSDHHALIWLHTDRSSRAVGFYERLKWKRMPYVENRDARFEKHRPQTSDRHGEWLIGNRGKSPGLAAESHSSAVRTNQTSVLDHDC